MTYIKIYEQMPVKQTKVYDLQMSDFTPMVKYSLSANSDNQFFLFVFHHHAWFKSDFLVCST